MTYPSSPAEGTPEALPEWAVASPPARRPEPSSSYVQLAIGLLLVAARLVIVAAEAWQILTQPTISTDGTVLERLGWPLIPAVFGTGLLVERWYDQRSIDVR